MFSCPRPSSRPCSIPTPDPSLIRGSAPSRGIDLRNIVPEATQSGHPNDKRKAQCYKHPSRAPYTSGGCSALPQPPSQTAAVSQHAVHPQRATAFPLLFLSPKVQQPQHHHRPQSPPTLKVFPPRHRNKHSNQHPPNHRPTQQALHKDGILNLPQRRLPDPNLPIKHLPHHVPPLIFHNPRLALKTIPRPKALKRPLLPRRSLLDLLPLSQKQLPRPHMPMMHPMQHDTHPLPRRHQRRRPQHPPDRHQRAPPARARRQRQQHRGNDTRDDQSCAEDAREEYPRRVAVADGPADEVGVGLAAEGGLDGADDVAQRRGVRGVGEGVEGGFLLAVREV